MSRSIANINATYSSLPPAEKKVADYILENTEEIIYLSVSELAEKTSVSDSTIIRLCKNIGFDGYQEFKLVLAQDLVQPMNNINENITEDDNLASIIEKTSYANTRAIEESNNLNDLEDFKKAINAIIQCDKLFFYGVGASGNTCLDAKYKFLRIGMDCDAYTDSHIQAMSASTLSAGDVVVGISQSGSTKDTVHSCEIARKNGATIICITSHKKSPITRVASIKLMTSAKKLPLASGNLSSKIAQLHVLDLLFTGVALQLPEQTINYIDSTARAVINKLY